MADLKDDETRMVRFDKLSKARKEEIRKAAQDEMRAAESQRKRPITSRILDTMTEYHPFIPKNKKEEHAAIASEDTGRREKRFTRAQQEANLTDAERAKRARLYSDTQIHKINPDESLFKKGGKVSSASKRADGCAKRGKTKGRIV